MLAIAAALASSGQEHLVAQPVSPVIEASPAAEATEPMPPVVTPKPTTLEPAPPEVAEAIKQLDDDRYAIRQSAQRRLAELGAPALEHTAQVAGGGSLESATRAMNVLWKWAESTEQPLNRHALEKIAANASRPIDAAEATRRLVVLREKEAIDAIVKLGGRVEPDRSYGFVGGDGAPLQVIVGKHWTGGVDGLKHVADIPRATTLSLWRAPLQDDAMPRLATLKNLRRMELYGLQMTPELVDQAREKLPNTMIEVRGPARLGIRGLDAIEIVPNSPAAKAGLVIHDRITEFNGVPIETFEQLTTEIGKCNAGDSVAIKFRRGAEMREAKVTFDGWGDDVNPGAPTDAPPDQQGLFGRPPAFVPRRTLPFRPMPAPMPIVPRIIRPEPADPELPK